MSRATSHGGANVRCHNCGQPVPTPYCGHCGQKRGAPALNVGRIVGEYFHDSLRLERGVPLTYLTLLTRPGILTRHYLQGRRVRYSSPLRIYLLTSMLAVTLYVSTRSLDGAFYGYAAATDWSFVARALAYGFLLSVPLVAAALKLIYWRGGPPAAAHLIFAFHFGAAALVAAVVFLLLDAALKLIWINRLDAPADPAALAVAVPVVMAAYLYRSLRVVYGGGRMATVAATVAVALLVGVTVILVAVGVASMAEQRV